MKTDQIQNKGNLPYRPADRAGGDAKNAGRTDQKKETVEADGAGRRDRESTEQGDCHLDAVKKVIGENIEWRMMRFYRHEEDGKTYVDIINKDTGEIIRTVPEPAMQKIATEFKHLSGITLDING